MRYLIWLVSLSLLTTNVFARNVSPTTPVVVTNPDSTDIDIPTSNSVNIKVPGVVTKPGNVTTSNLPSACPATITGCPNINVTELDAGYNPSTCPTLCSVTSVAPATPADTTSPAVCPTGYSQIGSYNVQPEYKYSSTTDIQIPKNQTEYNNYRNAGYVCQRAGGGKSYFSSCYSGNLAKDQTKDGYYGWPGSSQTTRDGNYSYIISANRQCYNYDKNCDGGYIKQCNYTNTVSQATWDYLVYYENYQCTKVPGNYATGQYLPASVLCARITPTW